MIDCSDKLLYIDADTLLYSSAAKEEVNKCLAKHVPSGREKLFESKTEFNTWLKANSKWNKEDFEFTVVKELNDPDNGIRFACASFKQKVANIVEAVGAKDYFVCIQGEGNFRKTYPAKYVQYKAQRGEKPILFKELYDWVKVKYKHRCVAVDGEETDEYVVRAILSGNVGALCDKDIFANASGLFYNYMKPEDGVFVWTDEQRWKKYWWQTLCGDSGDNIDGIVHLAQETKDKYGIKTKGVGGKTADAILDGCVTEKEAAERVLEAYLLAWPEDGYERMKEMCFFLWMRRWEGQMFDLDSYLKELGVEHGN